MLAWYGEDHAEPFYNQFIRFGGAYGKDVFDLRPVIKRVVCLTFVLYPDRSFLFDVEQGVAFYKNLANGELTVLPDCGHNNYEQRLEEYIRYILYFLEKSESIYLKQIMER